MVKRSISIILIMLLIISIGNPVFGYVDSNIDFNLDKITYSMDEYIQGSGVMPGGNLSPLTYIVENDDTVYELGQINTDSQGNFNIKFKMPYGAEEGRYTLKIKFEDFVKTVSFLVYDAENTTDDEDISDESVEHSEVIIIKNEDGTTTAKFIIELDDLKDQIDDEDKEEISIEVSVDEDAEEIILNLASNTIEQIFNSGKKIEIVFGNAVIVINPGAIDVKDRENIELKVRKLDEDESKEIVKNKDSDEFSIVSEVLDFNLESNGEKLEFIRPLIITIKYDVNKVSDYEKLGVYYYNEENEKWEYVGGNAKDDGTIVFSTGHFSKYTVMEYNKTFKDVDISWANHEIEVLTARHVVNGVDGENFKPYGNVTRAEFSKMIVKALNLSKGENTLIFNDVEESKWYAEPISIASSLGIVQGYGGKFNPNDNISREAMATMVVRALKYVNPNGDYSKSTLTFTDNNDISTWAKDNAAIANSIGLINGVGNNTFAPKDNATRAQAAVMVYRLLNILDK